MDVQDISPGENFADAIDRSIAAFETVLVVIGPRWSEILRDRAQQQDPDYVMHEVSAALAHKLRVVPVLVGGARMPGKADLPPALSGLAFHQGFELRDSTFAEDCERLLKKLRLEKRLRKWMLWAAIAAAVAAGVFAFRGLVPRPADPRLATARTQTELGEHRSAFETYREILKSHPGDTDVMNLQATEAMAWVREFRVTLREGERPEEVAGRPLGEIIGVLEAALARNGKRGSRAGDILAHLGWAHWLNQKIAQKEFGPAAERALRQSLEVDPGNFYAPAMLGNWMLQTGGETAEALRHFESAEKTNRDRPFLRSLQLGGMIYDEDPGIPAAIMRIVNRMRINGEPLDARQRSRVLTYFRPGRAELVQEMLTAVPPEEAWATFQWLDNPTTNKERSEYIHARVLELQGRKAEALELLTNLERRMRSSGSFGSLLNDVSASLKRLR